MTSVSTITPVRNDAVGLRRSIPLILAQDVEVDRIVIAVAPSDDDTEFVAGELARIDNRVVVVANPSGRTPNGLNHAIAACDSDVIVRVDARAFLPPGYIRRAVGALDATGAGNVGAVQRPVGETFVERAIAAAMDSRVGHGGAAYRAGGELRPVDTAWLGTFRRSALAEVGGYDEEFIRNQDAELNIRLNASGRQVWLDPQLVVEYRPRNSVRRLWKQYFEYGWWRLRTARKHPGSLRLRQLAAPVVVVGGAGCVAAAAVFGTPLMLLPLAVYGASMFATGVLTTRSPATGVVAGAALVTMHVAWGSGFVLSCLRHIRG